MTIYQLATEAGQQIKALDYGEFFHDDVMKCKSAREIVDLWLDFLLDRGNDDDFRERVEHTGTLPELLSWCRSARDLLSIGA